MDEIAIGREVIIGALGAGGALLLNRGYKWIKSGDQAKVKAAAVDRAAVNRDVALERRAEDRFVLKEVCEKCEKVRQTSNEALGQGLDHLRAYVEGIDKKQDALVDDVREIRELIIKRATI